MIKKIIEPKYIKLSLIILSILVIVLGALIPAEEKLGPIIKLVFVHAALVQSALIAFIMSGIAGLLGFFLKKDKITLWCFSFQKTALLMWALYFFSSMIVTYLSWGIAIAWNEPRVQMSIQILIMAVILLAVTIWIRKDVFTRVVNIFLAITVVLLNINTVAIRHPENPIGESGSIIYMILYFGILFFTLLITVQITRLFYSSTFQKR